MTAGILNKIRSQKVTLTASVGGTASDSIAKVVGEIFGVQVTLGTGMTTADLTVTTDGGEVVINGVTVTTDKFFPVRHNAVTNDGSTAITNSVIPYLNKGGAMTAAIASATATKSLTVTIIYR